MKTKMRPLSILLAVVFGCTGGELELQPDVTLSDSAGIRIKEYGSPVSWRAPVTLTEMARIGTLDGPPPTLFTTIAGGRILSDSTLVLADRGSQEVRLFSADGEFIGSHGREGQGPGEYEYIIGVGQCGPSGFTVFDIGWTMSFYNAGAGFVREQVTRLEGLSTPYELACDTDGRVAAVNWDLSDDGPTVGFHTALARLRILEPDGAGSVDLGIRIGSERFGSPSGSSGPHPAGRSTKFAFAGSDLIVSDGSFFGFERWDRDGSLKEIVRVRGVQPPDVDSLMSAYLEWTLARAPDEATEVRWRQQVLDMENPDRASHFSDVLVAEEHVLLREPNVGGGGRWFVFGLDGTPLGYLPLPSGARLLDYRRGRLLVAVRGEFDVMGAVLYSVAQER